MASRRAIPSLSQARPVHRSQRAPTPVSWSLCACHRARGVATSFLRKVEEGEQRWAERAAKIKSGELPHVWDILGERGYIKDVAGYVS